MSRDHKKCVFHSLISMEDKRLGDETYTRKTMNFLWIMGAWHINTLWHFCNRYPCWWDVTLKWANQLIHKSKDNCIHQVIWSPSLCEFHFKQYQNYTLLQCCMCSMAILPTAILFKILQQPFGHTISCWKNKCII